MFSTGDDIDVESDRLRFIDTIQVHHLLTLVFHVFEEIAET
jgi:hypothetical protein